MLIAAAALIGVAAFRIGRAALGTAGLWVDLGPPWAVVAVAALLLFRLSLPLRAGILLGAVSLLGWPWIAALALAAPRLFLVLPGLVSTALARWRHPRPVWQPAGDARS
jgi:hypothetical protein